MATYSFSAGQTQAFLPSSDMLQFSNGLSAEDVTVTSDDSGVMFTTPEGSMLLTGLVMGQLTSTNIQFLNGSVLEVGDDTTSVSADSSGNRLAGTSGNDQLLGMGGSDTIAGGAGNDIIFGGSGISDSSDAADSIDGGAGADAIYANGGDDTIVGSEGMDTVYGGSGNDSISYAGSSDNLLIYGNEHSDTVIAGSGDDTIYGGSNSSDTADNADSINGGGGADIIYANSGNDTVTGSSGADTVYGGYGNDSISYSGGTGDVVIYGNAGKDTLIGGSGRDTIYGGSAASDTADDADSIVAGAGADVVYANAGDDTINGSGAGVGGSTLYGGNGNDTIDWSAVTSGYGAHIYGNQGNDSITASTASGADYIQGGAGSDTLIFAAATDLSSSDSIWGGDASSDDNDIDRVKFSTNGITLSTGDLSNVTGIEAFTFLSDGGSNSITLSNALVSSSVSHTITISQATTGAGAGTLTVDASAVSSTSNTVIVTGGNGNDTLTGGVGRYTLLGGAGNDTIIIAASGFAGDSIDGGTGTNNLSLAGDINFANATVQNFQTLTFTGTGNVTATATEFSNFTAITGSSSVDQLTLSAAGTLDLSAATLTGIESINGAGTDHIFLGTVASVVPTINVAGDQTTIDSASAVGTIVNASAFVIGDSIPTVNLTGASDYTVTGLGVDLSSTGTGDITVTTSNTDYATSMHFANQHVTVTGGSGVQGADINLSINGITQYLTLFGSNYFSVSGLGDNISVDASAFTGTASISGTALNDTITGGSGNDTIAGNGGGSDSLNGGGANDTITAASDSGIANITGGSGADDIDLGSTVFGGVSIYTDNHAVGSTTGDLAGGVSNMDIISNFGAGEGGVLRFSGSTFTGSLIASGGTPGAAGAIAQMASATQFTNSTLGAVEYWDDGTNTYIHINTSGTNVYNAASDISFELAGDTAAGGTHDFYLLDNGDISANLIMNGSFESNNGSTGITDWTLNTASDTYVDAQVMHSGQWEFATGAVGTDAVLTQDNIPAENGEHYTLSFWLSIGTSDNINSFVVTWNGATVATLTNLASQDYVQYTYDVVGTAGGSTLVFTGTNSTYFTFLDDVSLTKT